MTVRNLPEYRCWQSIKQRCLNPRSQQFHNYGERGITICSRWLVSFENFYTDMGRRPPGTSIERIDNDGDYSPDNCRWATAAEQRVNQRNCNYIEYDGQKYVLTHLARLKNLDEQTLRYRLFVAKWPLEMALNTPATKRNGLKQYRPILKETGNG